MRLGRPLALLGAPLIAAIALLVPSAANAAPLYTDTSVVTSNATTDHGPVVSSSALPTSVATAPASVQFSGTPGDTWAVTPSTVDGYTVAIGPSTGLLTFTGTGSGALTSAVSFTVTSTDLLGAVGSEVVTLTPVTSPSTSVTASVVKRNLAGDLFGIDNNVTGQADYAVFPAPNPADTFSAANLPAGTSISAAGVLSATTAIPGTYKEVLVRAADANGSVAAEVVTLTVTGFLSGNDTPRLSHGHAVPLGSHGEDVYFILSGQDACIHFTIVGPGGINGHQGWVRGHVGLNVGVYGGLEANHGYTVFYQAVQTADPNSCAGAPTVPWPGSHWGYVYFVS